MTNKQSIYRPVIFLLLGVFLSCRVQKNIVQTTGENKPAISFQERKEFVFNRGDLVFSNRFPAARLNQIEQVNDSSFQIVIEPENRPVNPSPWYAFKIWSKDARNVSVSLNYSPNKHRYNPKISRDNKSWEEIHQVSLNADSTVSTFKIAVNQETVTVAAQPVINSAAANKWADSLSRLSFIKRQVIGRSSMGKPIVALHNTESDGKRIVVVISRQHPPEITGFLAMQEFVHTLLSQEEIARKFRQEYKIIIVPVVNPDGVDEGNWRHSAAGVDLNRDWEFFRQPETRAVRDFLLKKIAEREAKVYFALDFHSTWYDILYTNSDTLTNIPGLTRKWIVGFEDKIGEKLRVRPSGNGGNVSKSWFMRELKADAITYEVGDDTSEEKIREKGRIAARVMMGILEEEAR